jgi:hypothetical protein
MSEELKAMELQLQNEEFRRLLAEKDAEMERLCLQAAKLEELLGECIRNKYYDEATCSPSWLKEVKELADRDIFQGS